MANDQKLSVRTATRTLHFTSDQVRNRGDLARKVQSGKVIKIRRNARAKETYLNLARVEEVL